MSRNEEMIVPNDFLVRVKDIRAMQFFDDGNNSISQMVVIDDSDKELTFRLKSPTLQAGAWAAFNALRSSYSVQVEILLNDGNHEVRAIYIE